MSARHYAAIMHRARLANGWNDDGPKGTILAWSVSPQYLIRWDDGTEGWHRDILVKVFDETVIPTEVPERREFRAEAERYRLAWLSARRRSVGWMKRWIDLALPKYRKVIADLEAKLAAIEDGEGGAS